jgi:hypothetical protein
MGREEKRKIRRLIDDIELCHHKAERHVDLIIEAIGRGDTTKGYRGTEPERTHPATQMWQNAVDILSAWLADDAGSVEKLGVGDLSSAELLGCLGAPTPLKRWQVAQLIQRIKAASRMFPDATYHEMMEFPERHQDDADFCERTVESVIHDMVDGAPAEIPLAAAIDHLMPCNWNFESNLALVLRAIGGDLSPAQPFAAHGRNVRLSPIRDRMQTVADTLWAYCDGTPTGGIDRSILNALGEHTPERAELASLLEQKIRDVFA